MANSVRNAGTITKPQRVFTIPPTASFLDELAQSLIDGRLIPNFKVEDDWSVLADVTIYLPTRRAARTLAEIFRTSAPNKVVFLPKIRPLGDIDESNQLTESTADSSELPPEIGYTERHLALTRLILRWTQIQAEQRDLQVGSSEQVALASPTDAVWLSRELLMLMDQIEGEEANWSQLSELVPDQYAEYWQMTIEFLKIATEVWPKFLMEQGKMDPMARNFALIRNEAEFLAKHGSSKPIIAAGSTGTARATRTLLKTIAELPNGAVILPGIDLSLDDKSWNLLTDFETDKNSKKSQRYNDLNPGHPQFGLAKLIRHIGIAREEIVPLCQSETTKLEVRNKIVSEAMKPIRTTDSWVKVRKNFKDSDLKSAFEDCALVEARNEIEEGLAIALVLREAIENGETAALVLTDQNLVRRVVSELERWSIQILDYTVHNLKHSSPTILARLVTKLALRGLDAVTMLSVLKHPITRVGFSESELKFAISAFERGILRGPQSEDNFEGLRNALSNAKALQQNQIHCPKWQRLTEAEWEAVEKLIVKLEYALSPMIDLINRKERISVSELARLTLHTLQLVGSDNNGDDSKLFSYESTADLIRFLRLLIKENNSGLEILPINWPEFLDSLMTNISVLETSNSKAQVGIFTPIESRLHRPDLIILAGLSEGNWPKSTRNDPWLNRPMKGEMGLDQPERRIGLAAHDFCQSLGCKRVVMTRSLRSGGSPTVASRWLQRVLTVSGESVVNLIKNNGVKYLDWAQQLGSISTIPKPIFRPCPKPAIGCRPKQLSITEIETWVRDPYAIYARRILQLEPMDVLGGSPGAAEKGAIIHDCLAEFLLEWKGSFDDTALTRLVEIGVEKFESIKVFPQLYALWWPRFQRIASWFVNEFEKDRNENVQQRFLECSGNIEIPIGDQSFKLTGRADRIDLLKDGTLSVLDYKTGQVPSLPQVESLLAPQLPLEVAMIKSGGFRELKSDCAISDQAYVVLSGGKIAGEVNDRTPKNSSAIELASRASKNLHELINSYADQNQGYLSRARVFKEKVYSAPYDHLARVQEWSVGIVDEDD